MNFVVGGLAGCFSTFLLQPFDYVKVQLQVHSEMGLKKSTFASVIKHTYTNYGFFQFYRGVDSALLRQLIYTSTRVGVFYQLTDMYKSNYNRKPGLITNIGFSIICAVAGAFMANPTDLILIRMQSDMNLPPEKRRNYKNVFNALFRTVNEEGFFKLWTGAFPTVIRGVIMTTSTLVTFEEFKKLIAPYVKNDKYQSLFGSLCASLIATTVSLPFDNAKTKLQKMKKENGVYPYKGIKDAMYKTYSKEGFKSLWVGISSYYISKAPKVIITLLTIDFLRRFFGLKKIKKDKELI